VILAGSLTNPEVFLLGALGGLLVLAITQILPTAVQGVRSGVAPDFTPWRVFCILVIGLIFLVAGGGAAVLIGDVTEAKTALSYGMAWQAILGGVIKTGEAALPKDATG